MIEEQELLAVSAAQLRSAAPQSESGTNSDASDDASTGGSEHSEDQVLDVPFEELEHLRHNGATLRAASKPHSRRKGDGEQGRKFTRDNKNRPMETSSKRPVPRLREVIAVPKREVRDPRFDSLSGTLNQDRFRKQYAFLYDEKLPAEREDIKAALQKTKKEDAKRELQAQLTRVQQQIREEQSKRRKETWEIEQKRKEREAIKLGKGVYFQKRSDKKRQELMWRYQELKTTGRLDKYMAKRRKKNALKDHRYVPSSRRQAGAGEEAS